MENQMKFIPCNTDAWDQAEKKAKRKVYKKVARSKKRGNFQAKDAKVHRNINAR